MKSIYSGMAAGVGAGGMGLQQGVGAAPMPQTNAQPTAAVLPGFGAAAPRQGPGGLNLMPEFQGYGVGGIFGAQGINSAAGGFGQYHGRRA